MEGRREGIFISFHVKSASDSVEPVRRRQSGRIALGCGCILHSGFGMWLADVATSAVKGLILSLCRSNPADVYLVINYPKDSMAASAFPGFIGIPYFPVNSRCPSTTPPRTRPHSPPHFSSYGGCGTLSNLQSKTKYQDGSFDER